MPTEFLFRDDAYLQDVTATVLSVNDEGGFVLDRTVFYPQGGGQPGDRGAVRLGDGTVVPVSNAIYALDRSDILHVPAGGVHDLRAGAVVTAMVDWERRYRLMRAHTALHLLSVVLPYPVTGGAVGEAEGRLDFDIPDAGDLDRETAEARLNELIALDRAVTTRWITDAELDANPGLVKTMKVQPPRGSGQVRLVEIDGLDLQPCGGTHVRTTGEIGRVAITKIEKKGRINRRVRIELTG
jgi:misacylated tRNA(Ala) deacylase